MTQLSHAGKMQPDPASPPGTLYVVGTPIGNFEDSKSLQLRMEVFNVFNHTNFRAIASANVTSTVYGQISTVRDPRTIQIGAKLTF